jgi:hypothetical protein
VTTQTTEPTSEEIWALFKATDAQFKQTDEKLAKLFAETDAKLRRLEGLFHSQWGRLIEALVQPNALRLFQERGIPVRTTYQRAISQRNGESMEIDLILEDGEDVVLVEAKSRLNIEAIDDFLEDLAHFLEFFPRYAGRQIFGAVAGVSIEENADRYAYKRGLFVLGLVGGDMVQILNDAKFRPRNFGATAGGR